MNEKYRRHIRSAETPRRILRAVLAAAGVAAVVVLGFAVGRRVGHAPEPPPARTGEDGRVVVFLAFPRGGELEMIAREIPEAADSLQLGQRIVRELMAGPGEPELEPVTAEGAELRAFYLDPSGVAFIDLDRQALNIPRDALGEYLAIESFFESLRRNLPEVRGVKFLIDSNEVDSLWGHFDASLPWTAPYEEP